MKTPTKLGFVPSALRIMDWVSTHTTGHAHTDEIAGSPEGFTRSTGKCKTCDTPILDKLVKMYMHVAGIEQCVPFGPIATTMIPFCPKCEAVPADGCFHVVVSAEMRAAAIHCHNSGNN